MKKHKPADKETLKSKSSFERSIGILIQAKNKCKTLWNKWLFYNLSFISILNNISREKFLSFCLVLPCLLIQKLQVQFLTVAGTFIYSRITKWFYGVHFHIFLSFLCSISLWRKSVNSSDHGSGKLPNSDSVSICGPE